VSVTAKKREPSVAGRLLIDLGPLLVFFLTNYLAPVPDMARIFYATGGFMAAMIVAMMISYLRYRYISPMLWFSGIMVVILGGITIWLHNPTFIKMKPTAYYLLIAGLLAFGLATRRNLLKIVLGAAYPGLSERGWQLLSRNWAIFFLVMAVVNEAVWRNSSDDFWIGFKLWGFLPATFLFAIANVPMLMKHGMQLEKGEDEPPVPPSQ
jgi:intracellular septation protein